VRVRQGFRVGDLRRRAAAVYRDIGADRALALLLRTTGWAHDLGDFQVPSSQFKRPSAGLTPRELEVADLARLGFTVAEIAERLSISPQTSATHLKNLKRKLGITRKSELVRLNEDL
jgi:DNA-binding CsgD family transcriptional regulator